MTHVEDRALYGGADGTRQAIKALTSLRDMLAGHHSSNVSVKWDGAPAIFAGTDPRDGKFFVAKKGVFNKTPKLYKTNAEMVSTSDPMEGEVFIYQACQFGGSGSKMTVGQYPNLNDSINMSKKEMMYKNYMKTQFVCMPNYFFFENRINEYD